ncbi:MAG: trypsin-like peptidase domain-containing protein [Actinomycetota bacterium]|nr:trypsin-like peptidase domain-containing protein [Actinomycetota bacterium]
MLPRTTRPSARSLALLAVVLVLTACSGGSSKSAAPTSVAPTSTTPKQDAASRIPDVIDRVQPSLVTVLTQAGLGSGVIYDKKGTIVTDDHVVAGATSVQVAFADGTRMKATITAEDASIDIAVLHVDRRNLPPAHFERRLPRVGEEALAMGSPLGFSQSVTAGIISGLHRQIPGSAARSAALVDLVQTDAPISPGNSGGALINVDGAVIGVNEAYLPPQTGAVSIGFAIPAATVVDDVEQLLKSGHASHAFLGLQQSDVTPQVAQQLSVSQTGALVVDLVTGGPADKAGIRPGDIIRSVAGASVSSAEDLVTELRKLTPGQTVPIVVLRSGSTHHLHVTLTDRPT